VFPLLLLSNRRSLVCGLPFEASVTTDALIARLQERAQDPYRANDSGPLYKAGRLITLYPPVAHPPISESDVDAAEEKLGFPLPVLVRLLYTEVGNGGFGPSKNGLYPLIYPADWDFRSPTRQVANAVDQLLEWRRWRQQDRHDAARAIELLDLCCWGCEAHSSLDCSVPEAPVIWVDGCVELPGDYRGQVCCWLQHPSLAGWLEEWLNGANFGAGPPETGRND
jgi:hypothetical protein